MKSPMVAAALLLLLGMRLVFPNEGRADQPAIEAYSPERVAELVARAGPSDCLELSRRSAED